MEFANVTNAADDSGQTQQLIEAARNGCQKSLEILFAVSRNYLLTIAHGELPPDVRIKVAPSDLVQESLIEAHRDFGTFSGHQRQELLAWLRRILLHNLANAKRKYRDTSKRELSREVFLDGFDSSTGRPVELPDVQSSPSSIALEQERLNRLQAAIERLPEEYRTVILLRHRDHQSFEFIAAELKKTSEATRKVWSRAVERLRQELGEGQGQS